MAANYNDTIDRTAPSNAHVVGRNDPIAETTNQQGSTTVAPQSLYKGVVEAVDVETRRLSVRTGPNTVVTDCVYLSGALAPLVGVGEASLPAPGSAVLLLHTTGESFVIGTYSDIIDNAASFKGRTGHDVLKRVLDTMAASLKVERTEDKQPFTRGMSLPGDAMPGEKVLGTCLGPAVRVLNNFAQMDSGGLAKVEVCLLNDLVRIFSNYFVNDSCGGREEIWSTGYTTRESHFTSYQFEADSKKDDHDTVAVEGGAALDTVASAEMKDGDNGYSATGRWRYTEYLGFLGDMIHTFVTNPVAVQSTFHEKAVRAGNFRSWVGADGTLMVQAAGGIHLEVRKNISIPHILRAWSDPKCDLASIYKDLDEEYLKIWGEGPDWKDLVVSCWQLRNYARYITLFHSLARFLQLEKATEGDGQFCKVYGEDESKPNSSVAAEKDKSDANRDKAYTGHASITIDPAGSITVQQGNTASIVLNQGNIQISAPGNIELVAGNTISMRAKHIAAVSALDTEVSSTHGKLTMRSKNSMKFLAEHGRMWFKSDADDAPYDGFGYDEDAKGDDFSPFSDTLNKRELQKYAMIFDTSKGKMLVHSKKELSIASEDTDILMQADKGKVFIGAEKQVQVLSGGIGYTPESDGKPKAKKGGSILLNGSVIGVTAETGVGMDVGELRVNKMFKVKDKVGVYGLLKVDGAVETESLRSVGGIHTNAGMIAVGGYMGPSEHVAAAMPVPFFTPGTLDMINQALDDGEESAGELDMDSDGSNYEPVELSGRGNTWMHRDAYDIESGSPIKWNSLKRPMYSDAIDHDGYDNNPEWREIASSDTAPDQADRTSSGHAPWPGMDAQIFEFKDGLCVLTDNATKEEAQTSEVIKTRGDMSASPFYWRGLKSTNPQGDGMDILYKFASIPVKTEPPTDK